jgi:NPCBM/NEW2 domain
MTNDQALMTNSGSPSIGHWSLVIGHFLATTLAAFSSLGSELVPLNGEPVEAELQAIDAEKVQLMAKSPITFPLKEFVRWGHSREPRAQILVVLADGGRLVASAAWSGGAPLRLDGPDIVVVTGTWGELRLPRSLVAGVVFAQRSHPRDRQRLEAEVRKDPASNPSLEETSNARADFVLLTNKDRVTGKMAALSGGSLTLETQLGPVKLPLSRIEAIAFGGRESSVVSRQWKFALGLDDGSVIFAHAINGNEKELAVEAGGGIRLEGGRVDDIALLQSLGGRFVYLSDLEPDGYRHEPYLSIEWPYQRDRNVHGGPLSVGGKLYLKGIGMHSAARLTYRLNGQYRRFDAMAAVDDSADQRGSVAFGVYVLRDGKWSEAYTSAIVRGGEAPRPVSVDVTGGQGLTLTVDFADRGDELDHADWLDARLIKTEY